MKKDLGFHQRINVTQPKLPDYGVYCDYVKRIWDNKWLTNNGPLHEEFKSGLKGFLNVNNVELFTNGHLALESAIKALDLRGEVITTPFTFASTIHAITNCGLKPVFCDVEMDTFNIDVGGIERHITKNTSAILAVHVFGTPCNVKKINELAEKYNLKIIYDAAHAFGVEIEGQSIADFGDLSMFSFHATKLFHSIEGGMLSFKNAMLSEKLMAVKNFGITSSGSVDYVGTNAKMGEFQAAMGLCNLKSIEEDIAKREAVYKQYANNLKGLTDIYFLPEIDKVKHNYSYFPILMKNPDMRDWLFEKLKEYNVFTRKYFNPLGNDFNCYDFNTEDTPNAVNISERILSLPMYTELNTEAVKQICDIIKYELGGYKC